MLVYQSPFKLRYVHLRTAKCRNSQPKYRPQEFDMSRLRYLCGMLLRHEIVRLVSKVAKNLAFCGVFVIFFMAACGPSGQEQSDKQAIMMQYSDSLWQEHKLVTSLFRYKLDVIKERKGDMKATLQELKFASASSLSEEQQSLIVKYEAVYRVYRDIVETYTNTVLRAEELFYAIKGLEKQVKAGSYGTGSEAEKLTQFKKEFQSLKQKLDALLVDAEFIDHQLSAVEPAYQSSAEKVESLVAKKAL